MGAAVAVGIGVLRITHDGNRYRDLRGFRLDRHCDLSLAQTVGQRNRLLSRFILVVAGNLHIRELQFRSRAVRPDCGQFDAGKVQLVANSVLRLIRTGNSDFIAGRLNNLATSDFSEQLIDIFTKGIVGTIVVCPPCTAFYFR